MSKTGGVQRGVLQQLEDGPSLLSRLLDSTRYVSSTGVSFELPPTRVSVRRALRGLERRGLVRPGDLDGQPAVFPVERHGLRFEDWEDLVSGRLSRASSVRLLTKGTPPSAYVHAGSWRALSGNLLLGQNAWGFAVIGGPLEHRFVWMGYFQTEAGAREAASWLAEAKEVAS